MKHKRKPRKSWCAIMVEADIAETISDWKEDIMVRQAESWTTSQIVAAALLWWEGPLDKEGKLNPAYKDK